MVNAATTYAMLGKSTLWEAAVAVHSLLRDAGAPHGLIGGVAVCLHGYERNTIDVDLLVRSADADRIREALLDEGWLWDAERREFRSPAGAVLQLVFSGERAGRDSEVRLPDPGDPNTITVLEGLPVLTLARLIESKLACGQGNLRRTHRDFADVVELVAGYRLGRDFARRLHPSVREAHRELVRHARGE